MKTGYFVLAATLFAGAVAADSLKNARPNIIFVMTDDQGSNLSFMGHPYIETPHIDRFAKQSLYFKEYHVSPSCAPTRAALMSGRHEFRNGVTHTVHERELMALSTTTFPQLLQRAGYTTGIFGKWHLGDQEAYLPVNRGFDEVLVHGAGGIGQAYSGSNFDFPPNRGKGSKAKYFDPVLLHNDTIVQTKGYCTDLFFNAALGWIKKNHEADKPYFAYISPNAPHSPLIAPKESYDRIAKRHPELKKVSGRYAMIERIDDNFGLMMKKLKEWGALDNTLIIFTTDNGAPYRGPESNEFNAGYKTGKGSPYEGGVHVPAFWYWKGVLQGGKTVDALTAHIDLFKTFCDLAGAEIPADIQPLDGRSLLPLLENPDAEWEKRQLFTHRGRWDKGAKPERDANWAVRTERWRLVGRELYDIAHDPYEDQDVSAQYPEVVEQLKNAYYKWWDETVPYMINEDRECELEDPLGKRYYKQLEERGIPDWVPYDLDL
ncbi:arylsulfatase [Pontiella agarivorans]|uniref:Arylsulfatase n=1 Tax=Pontiella agarivorans TaxID=3038953 RepID=A0ABU5MS27_9BACT|nr:arylsulfatase [Pontiella agarivorans]MDZ8117005.1 arylsulfatase [Pontiella agarivorans]